jgi:putative two-component system response regulator
MHDIGKVGTPDKILYKSEKLDQYEFALMKLHTLTGFEIMQNSTSRIMQMAADIALGHHEKFDGTGYPKGLKGESIPLAARICAIADVFDALTSERAYKKAWSIEQALDEVDKQSGKHFDPFLVQKFKSLLPEISNIRNQYSSGPLQGMD